MAKIKSINLNAARSVIYNKVGAVLLGVAGVIDHKNLLLNNATSNVVLGINEIPSLGTVKMSEI